jgi:glutamine synthetase
MLRLPRNRPALENRAVDSAANPYLAAAFLMAAGLEGVAAGLDPGEPVEDLVYDWDGGRRGRKGVPAGASRLPRNLLEAIDAFDADPLTAEVFPPQFVDAYVDMKTKEWDTYHAQVSEWERRTYLEMF